MAPKKKAKVVAPPVPEEPADIVDRLVDAPDDHHPHPRKAEARQRLLNFSKELFETGMDTLKQSGFKTTKTEAIGDCWFISLLAGRARVPASRSTARAHGGALVEGRSARSSSLHGARRSWST